MIDIHTHILPLVDDGAGNFGEAIEMLKLAYEMGTNEMVLTPHCAKIYGFANEAEEIREKFEYFSDIAGRKERIPIRLYPGMEVLYEGKERMKKSKEYYLTLNDSRYLLMEFMFDISRRTFLEGIDWARECGVIPVVAHPERYDCVQEDWKLVREAQKMGAGIQVNEGSLFGRYGQLSRHTAHIFLEKKMVQCIASDAHHLTNRTPKLDRARFYLEERYGRSYAKMLLHDNPGKILRNQEFIYEIGEIQREK